MMQIAALIILILFSIAGFAALFFTTIGTLIILIGALIYSLMTGLSILTVKTLIILAVLYGIGELFENLLIITGAKKFGASNAAVVGAFIGGMLGAALGAPLLGVGLIIGAFLGIFLGAFIVELFVRKDLVKSVKAGTGSFLGRISSIAVKVVIAIVMFVIMGSNIFN